MLNIKGNVNRVSNISGNVARPETVYIRELDFKSRFEFPSVGDSKTLYIATDEDMIYRFDETSLTYKKLSSDWQEIGMIEGI